ncbi:hypothetical protein MPH_13595 [Macrophomina phaseolina MS6]|uniref:Uncharacterized protein n=1 Tax=Macrophomina phaseolina (strain MS6) TaxID=1126212 RepID=K2RH05_MACPH|nr:hypothetical protein MPH_13595 [Macrophomina phaseolina MS6]
MSYIVHSRYWICTGDPGASRVSALDWTGANLGSSSNPIQQDHWRSWILSSWILRSWILRILSSSKRYIRFRRSDRTCTR